MSFEVGLFVCVSVGLMLVIGIAVALFDKISKVEDALDRWTLRAVVSCLALAYCLKMILVAQPFF